MHRKHSFESQLTQLSLAASLPVLLLLVGLEIYAEVSVYLILLTILVGGLLVAYCNIKIYQKSAYQFRSLSNLLEAMIQGDYSLRARSDKKDSALNELVDAINGLSQRLSQQRLESVESQLLLKTVIDHIDVAIIAIDSSNQISLINPAAEKLLQLEHRQKQTQLSEQLSQVQQLSSGHNQVMELSLGDEHGKFNLHIEEFRESGEQNKLIFITDVRNLLRSEERKAWQDLVRVISHEINNSLAPITSISQTLKHLLDKQGLTPETKLNLLEGLVIVAERAKGLSTFVNTYKQITSLPKPDKKLISIKSIVNRVVGLLSDTTIAVIAEKDYELELDSVQIEQVLINLLKNASEAMQQHNPGGQVEINWYVKNAFFVLVISDQGPGVQNLENLFVPFYTTKKRGSGIGLVLSRQVIEAHNGHLRLKNRRNQVGCKAIIEIPLRR